MKKIEDMLKINKTEIDNINIPESLEVRLRNALKTKKVNKRKDASWKSWAAVAVIAILLTGYHFDTLAYYGKKLMGYDQIMNGTLKELNELGKGQVIGESYTFKNGITVILDGIMLDENQLIAFYTLKNSQGNIEDVNFSPFLSIEGILGNYDMRGGQGNMNEDKTEIKWMMDFKPPFFFEKTLDFKFAIREKSFQEEGKITFVLDRSKAMGHTLKKSINKSIKVDETKIRFDDIWASPTRTVIKGSIQNIVDLAKDQLLGERFRPNHMEVKLTANGKEVQPQGSGMSTDMKGITFHFDYDALPVDLQALQLEIVSFSADHDIGQKIDLEKDGASKSIKIFEQNIDINKVYGSNGNTYVTITTEENTVLTRVHLLTDGKTVRLEKTTTDDYEKLTNGAILHTRTLEFPGTGNDLQLDIQRISYKKNYNKKIDININ
ncbi:MAG: DUF4179 domain-containing protein [Clostridia bacterium]